jgi:hypothetical protein
MQTQLTLEVDLDLAACGDRSLRQDFENFCLLVFCLLVFCRIFVYWFFFRESNSVFQKTWEYILTGILRSVRFVTEALKFVLSTYLPVR